MRACGTEMSTQSVDAIVQSQVRWTAASPLIPFPFCQQCRLSWRRGVPHSVAVFLVLLSSVPLLSPGTTDSPTNTTPPRQAAAVPVCLCVCVSRASLAGTRHDAMGCTLHVGEPGSVGSVNTKWHRRDYHHRQACSGGGTRGGREPNTAQRASEQPIERLAGWLAGGTLELAHCCCWIAGSVLE